MTHSKCTILWPSYRQLALIAALAVILAAGTEGIALKQAQALGLHESQNVTATTNLITPVDDKQDGYISPNPYRQQQSGNTEEVREKQGEDLALCTPDQMKRNRSLRMWEECAMTPGQSRDADEDVARELDNDNSFGNEPVP